MTIGSTTVQTSGSTGNGATTSFSFSFSVEAYGAVTQAQQIEVIQETIATGVETVLTPTTHYTTSFNADQSSSPGGSITMVTAPSSSYKIWIRLAPSFLQATDYQNQGGFLMETVEDQADQQQRQINVLQDRIRRAPRVGIQAGASFGGEVTGDLTAGYTFIVNQALTGYTLGAPSSVAVSAAMTPVVQAATTDAGLGVLNGTLEVATKAALEALTAGVVEAVVVRARATAGDGGGGVFHWRSGDQSANVTADTQGGVWVAPSSDTDGSSGAWQRITYGYYFAAWFGAVGDGSTDDASALNGAINYASYVGGGVVLLDGKAYAVASPVALKSGVTVQGVGGGQYPTVANAASANFTATAKSRILAKAAYTAATPVVKVATTADALYVTHSVRLQGVMIDCANIADYGLDVISIKHCRFDDVIVYRPKLRGILEDCLVATHSGTAQAGGASTITFATTASTRDDLYNGQTVTIDSGTGSGQSRTISDYVGSTQVATVSSAWGTQPDATSVYSVTGDGSSEGNNATQFNRWSGVTVWAGDTGSAAVGWVQIGNPTNNINANTYENCLIIHRDGDGLQIWNADRQTFIQLMTTCLGTGVGCRLYGNDKNATEFARNIKFFSPEFAVSGGSGGGLTAKAGTIKSVESSFAIGYSVANGNTAPVIEAGANFWYIVDGGSAFSDWLAFTPTATFATVGDLSVSYSVQAARYRKIGRTVEFAIRISFTPTYTTASGDFIFDGLPFTSNSSPDISRTVNIGQGSTGWTYGASCTFVSGRVLSGTTTIKLYGHGSGIADVTLGVTQFPTGTAKTLILSGSYEANV